MNRSLNLVSGALVWTVMAACGGAPAEQTAPDAQAESDAPIAGAASCTSSGPPRAAVIAVQGSTPEIIVMTLADGQLVDRGFHFTGIKNPQYVTMRADGQEAVVAYGGFGVPFGIVAVTLAADGSSASIGTPVQLGTAMTPQGVTYVSNDRVVLTASGATIDKVITLDRGASGFAETARVSAPGRFPIDLVRRPTTNDAIMARLEFGVDEATTAYLLSAGGTGGYMPKGTSVAIAPTTISIGVHPSGNLVYTATSNPSDEVSSSNLEATGLLRVLSVSDAGLVEQPTIPMSRLSGRIAVDPNGGMLVFDSAIYEKDQSDNPTVRGYALLTMPLDGAGAVGVAHPPSAPLTALLLNDMQFAASGHLVTALELYPDSVPDAEAHPVEVRVQSAPGQWDVCQTVQFSGAAHLAFAP